MAYVSKPLKTVSNLNSVVASNVSKLSGFARCLGVGGMYSPKNDTW